MVFFNLSCTSIKLIQYCSKHVTVECSKFFTELICDYNKSVYTNASQVYFYGTCFIYVMQENTSDRITNSILIILIQLS